ncbi:hypothetical protein N7471_002252 [Penicillium samsonianum]|uniref:uncharacterized protein n=1 Tax=Penicillium samsonianum TaxID=1882272 RepID=UPI002549A15C|nr:uncharacterized protein N7471_002252 [Penicillium samsonianum]KAJ6142799.1 hypothetical protein N7471_002252 [Penicillium samsonianum]
MAGPIDTESIGKRWVVRACEVVALEVRSAAGLWCFALVLVLAGVPSVLLEFASLEREGDLRRWLNWHT